MQSIQPSFLAKVLFKVFIYTTQSCSVVLAGRLNTNEDNENMLGYDLYSSALADILSEPSLSMPISVGLYARWGSGKSFLLGKLEGKWEKRHIGYELSFL